MAHGNFSSCAPNRSQLSTHPTVEPDFERKFRNLCATGPGNVGRPQARGCECCARRRARQRNPTVVPPSGDNRHEQQRVRKPCEHADAPRRPALDKHVVAAEIRASPDGDSRQEQAREPQPGGQREEARRDPRIVLTGYAHRLCSIPAGESAAVSVAQLQ